jgi:hypothetical protein
MSSQAFKDLDRETGRNIHYHKKCPLVSRQRDGGKISLNAQSANKASTWVLGSFCAGLHVILLARLILVQSTPLLSPVRQP